MAKVDSERMAPAGAELPRRRKVPPNHQPIIDPEHTMTSQQRTREINTALWGFYKHVETEVADQLGFPNPLETGVPISPLLPLLARHINNIGDPFMPSAFKVNAHSFEQGVIRFFGNLFDVPPEDLWGYVTSGGTESVLQSMYTARQNFPDAPFFFSKESHYCVYKAARMMGVEKVEINTQEGGEIDYGELREALRKNREAGRKAVVNLNVGTTVRGAIDDIDKVAAILEETGNKREDFFINADAALFGMMLALGDEEAHGKVSFRKPIDAIAVSGHKFIGCPMPCGICIIRRHLLEPMRHEIPYLSSIDDTLTGSRNGMLAVYLWYLLSYRGIEAYKEDVRHVYRMSEELKSMLEKGGVKGVQLNPYSNIVVFPTLKEHNFAAKWDLSSAGGQSHVVVLPTMDPQTLKLFGETYIACKDAAEAAERGEEVDVEGIRKRMRGVPSLASLVMRPSTTTHRKGGKEPTPEEASTTGTSSGTSEDEGAGQAKGQQGKCGRKAGLKHD